MARQVNSQDILAAARKRNEDRLAAVERLVGEGGSRAGVAAAERALAEVVAAAQARVEEAKAADAQAYADALKVWTARELRGVGVRPLGARAVKPAPARRKRGAGKPAGGATPEEQRAADDLSALTEEMGLYEQPSPAPVV